jgi:di/tricarboxylate transporter
MKAPSSKPWSIPHAEMVGRTVREVNFRQRYRVVVLALHRKGRNVRDQLDQIPIAAGDVLLMMGTDQAIDALRHDGDFVLFDQERLPAKSSTKPILLVLGLIAGVVVAETFNLVPIELGALIACLILCASGYLKPKEAYDAIEWPILFVIFGMLAMGLAMDPNRSCGVDRGRVGGWGSTLRTGGEQTMDHACNHLFGNGGAHGDSVEQCRPPR